MVNTEVGVVEQMSPAILGEPNEAPHDHTPGMELEHAIGYSSLRGGLFYHPDGKHVVYAAGGTVIICDLHDPHSQHILAGHDGMITCLSLGNSGRRVRIVFRLRSSRRSTSIIIQTLAAIINIQGLEP